jgi:hypothetical protein
MRGGDDKIMNEKRTIGDEDRKVGVELENESAHGVHGLLAQLREDVADLEVDHVGQRVYDVRRVLGEVELGAQPSDRLHRKYLFNRKSLTILMVYQRKFDSRLFVLKQFLIF